MITVIVDYTACHLILFYICIFSVCVNRVMSSSSTVTGSISTSSGNRFDIHVIIVIIVNLGSDKRLFRAIEVIMEVKTNRSNQ